MFSIKMIKLVYFWLCIFVILDGAFSADLNSICGMNSANIYEGVIQVDPSHHSWIVRVVTKPYGEHSVECSGVILNSTTILVPQWCAQKGFSSISIHKIAKEKRKIHSVYEVRDISTKVGDDLVLLTIYDNDVLANTIPICLSDGSEFDHSTKATFVWASHSVLIREIPESDSGPNVDPRIGSRKVTGKTPSSESESEPLSVRYHTEKNRILMRSYGKWSSSSILVYLKDDQWYLEGIPYRFCPRPETVCFERVTRNF
ncbi:uncharacterized protein LOC141854806 [Brevipalpus obovatus]|uniref:uncharacterized protein LOC141854806 n=1 Tax=Brevipalpus obovatus TaxID=246614 RepID=UPI003D9F4528